MAFRTVDLLASGPPSVDPYDPAAAAWALAAGFASRGADVRVLHPNVPTSELPPPGTTSVPVDLTLRRPGAAVEPADFATAAGRKIRRVAELVIRDPVGLGTLGVSRTARGPPTIVGFVRTVELHTFDRERAQRVGGSLVGRIDAWRDRRAVRRLELAALEEADRLFFDAPELPSALAHEYGIAERRLRPAPPPVAPSIDPPDREAAREALRLPLDVPVVVAPAAVEGAEPAGIDRSREAFRRIRPFFPGARLVIVGSSAPPDPGVLSVPGRDRGSFAGAFAAADVALFLGRVPGFDPGAILALRAGCVSVLGPGVRLPLDPGPCVQTLPSEDPGDAASALAELLADPALRRGLLNGAASYATRFLPERVAEIVEAGASRGAG